MKIKTAYRRGDIVFLNTNYGQYQFSRDELLAAEMQNTLGYVVAHSFTGHDRQAGRMLTNIYVGAVREVLDG